MYQPLRVCDTVLPPITDAVYYSLVLLSACEIANIQCPGIV
jgi:hypothetical protein